MAHACKQCNNSDSTKFLTDTTYRVFHHRIIEYLIDLCFMARQHRLNSVFLTDTTYMAFHHRTIEQSFMARQQDKIGQVVWHW